MHLIEYLHQYFLTGPQLLEQGQISEETLSRLQVQRLMPGPAYKLSSNNNVVSFFGEHQEQTDTEYYPSGYLAWLTALEDITEEKHAFEQFSNRYSLQLQQLSKQGLVTTVTKLNQELDKHLVQEWDYFLQGIYGLCTTTGLPEEIASKEIAICIIDEITDKQTRSQLNDEETVQLKTAIELLDAVSAPFAPHEVEKSSRQRCINQVRNLYL